MLYIGNPKDFNKILLKLMNEFSNLPDYKISIEKSVAFWYMNNELSKKEIRKIFNQADERSVLKTIRQ